MKLLNEFVEFISERWLIHQRRLEGKPQPWTRDPILATYRFTNVRREDDRVTKWVHANWLRPNVKEPDLWFAIYVARIFNKPDTLHALGFPVPWTPKRSTHTFKICERLRVDGAKLFNGAYIVSTHRVACNSKHEFYIDIFNRLWQERQVIRPRSGDTLEGFYERLKEQKGLGSFMTAQVVADMKHAWPLNRAKDWWTFAHSGPGSRRGMGWVVYGEAQQHWREQDWLDMLHVLSNAVENRLSKIGNRNFPKLDAQNLQNCLCEFSKNCKVRYNGGMAKQVFKPSEEKYV